MNAWRRLRSRFALLWNRGAQEEDLQRELAAHLELEAKEQTMPGMTREEADSAARRAFGNVTVIAEDVRESWGLLWLEKFFRDLRYGARSLRKSPGFSLVAVLTLALGIGANTAIFSAIDSVMLGPLPFSNADELVRIYSTKDGAPIVGFAYPGGPSWLDMQDFAKANHAFQSMTSYDTWPKNVSFGATGVEPEQIRLGLVTAAYFEILGIQPVRGRLFTNEENRKGDEYVAAISERLWKSRFGGDEAILGRTIRINDEPYTIVAVMPDAIPEWMEPAQIDLWTPIAIDDELTEGARGGRGFETLARMRPGVTVNQAQADLVAIAAQLAAAHPADEGVGVQIKSLADTRAATLRPLMILLMGAVSLILLIACVNLANLLLARNSARQRELAVRTALGAGRGGLVRQLLAETMLLSLVGGGIGFALAEIGLISLAHMQTGGLEQLGRITMDWRVLIFTLAISLLTALVFGLAPAITASKQNLAETLKQGGRSGTAGRGAGRTRNLLVVTEMAMSLMLLIGAGLLVQSILRLENQNLGIRQDHLLKGNFYLPKTRYPDASAFTRFCDQFSDKIRALPGVIDASITTVYPPNNGWTQMLAIPGHNATRIQDVPWAQFGVSDTHFLRTMGIPLLRGRDFSESDTSSSPAVALVSAGFERRYFPSSDPIGKKIHIGPPAFLKMAPGENVSDDSDVTIIGVVGDFKNSGLTSAPAPQITVLYSQHPMVNYSSKNILIRTATEPHTMISEIRAQLHDLDSDLPLAKVETIDDLVDEQTGGQRFSTFLLAAFAMAGLALAIVGIYGVTAYSVARRTQEMAVRLAIGAVPGNVLWLVLRQGLKMAMIGAVIGLLGAVACRQLLSGVLFGVSSADPATLAGSAVLLVAVAAMASAIPAAQVMRIDPAQTLRQD